VFVKGCVLGCVLLGLAVLTQADEGDRTIPWRKTVTAPKIDGTISPSEYPSETMGKDFVWGFDGSPSPIPIEFWLTSDDKHLYLAVRVKKDPGQVRADQFRPNASLAGDDTARLFIDATGVGEGGDSFTINASTGNSIRLFGGTANKVEWAGTFDSQGRKTESGWESECRIPWELISNRKPGTKSFKFMITVNDPKQDRNYVWQFWGTQPRVRPIWTNVEVPNIKNRQVMSVLPYVTTGAERDRSFGANVGLDFKTKANNGITYVGTVNPDLRNIENDVLSLGFSYFERLANEARPFFLEGRRFLPGGNSFTSQRVRDFDFAIKAFGQPTKWDRVGLLRTEDFSKRAATAFKYGHLTKDQQQVAVEYVGNSEPGRNNDVFGFGYEKNWGVNQIDFGINRSQDQINGGGEQFGFSVNHRTPSFNGGLYGGITSKNFTNRLGFVTQTDIRETGVYLNYNREFIKGPLLSWGLNARVDRTVTGSGARQSDGERASVSLTTRKQLGLSLGRDKGFFRATNPDQTFTNFFDNSTFLDVNYPANDPYRNVSVSRSIGKQAGVTQISNDVSVRFRPLNRLTGSFSWSEFKRETTDQQIIGSVAWDIGKYETISTRFVNQQDEWNIYFSYRLSGLRGNEFFVIVGDPNSLSFTPRLALKVVFPVRIALS
jgi:hypothetical protein